MEPKRLQVPVIGLRRSGKSSILSVVYNELHPDDTVFLESTTKSSFITSDSFLPIRIIDTPSRILLGDVKLEKGLPLSSPAAVRPGPPPPVPARGVPQQPAAAPSPTPDVLAWTDVSAVVFVIDSQDDYYEALSKLHVIILSAFAENQTIDFHIFVHKIDGYSNDYRQDTLATIQGKVLDDLVDSSPSFIAQPWSYPEPPSATESAAKNGKDRSRSKSKDIAFSRSPAGHNGNTSSGGGGYDASASEFSAYSSGGHRSDVPLEPGQINLDQAVRIHCHATSIYDTSVFVAFSKLQHSLAQKVKAEEYAELTPASAPSDNPAQAEEQVNPHRPAAPALERNWTLAESVEQVCDSICASCKFESVFLFDLPTRTFIGTDSAPFDNPSFDIVFDYAGFLAKFAGLYSNLKADAADPAPSASASQLSTSPSSRRYLSSRAAKESTSISAVKTPPSPARYASSVARLHPDRSLCFWQINHRISLIALMQSDVHADQTGLIDYNVTFFRRAVQALYDLAQNST